jgi:diacylglycerol kinase (ATP)
MLRLFRAVINSCRGFRAAVRSEEAFRQELVVLAVAVPVAFFLAQESWKRLALIGSLIVLLVVELLNTAIEKLADRVSREQEIHIGKVKDMSSAAVGLTILLAAVTWVLALAEWLGFM